MNVWQQRECKLEGTQSGGERPECEGKVKKGVPLSMDKGRQALQHPTGPGIHEGCERDVGIKSEGACKTSGGSDILKVGKQPEMDVMES